MAIYQYTDRVSYHDTMLHKYQNIKMSYSTEWCTSYVVNITFKVGGKQCKINLWVTYSLAFN